MVMISSTVIQGVGGLCVPCESHSPYKPMISVGALLIFGAILRAGMMKN